MNDYREDLRKSYAGNNDAKDKTDHPRFTSVTRAFFASAASSQLHCPRCGASLNFAQGIEWVGPDSFTCSSCSQLVNIRLIQQALRDLGVE
ncbi:MAG: hypothetical protein OEV85_13505 [Candidatus Thorarchaeota archaeon]|nr:hypothetical protein [Candidatus Thorarchaeota archaeon]